MTYHDLSNRPQEAIKFVLPDNVQDYIKETLREDEKINAKKNEEAEPIIDDIYRYLSNKELRAEQDRIAGKASSDVTAEERAFMGRDVIGNVGDPKSVPAEGGMFNANEYNNRKGVRNKKDFLETVSTQSGNDSAVPRKLDANIQNNTDAAKKKIIKSQNEGGVRLRSNKIDDIVRGVSNAVGLSKGGSSNSFYRDFFSKETIA